MARRSMPAPTTARNICRSLLAEDVGAGSLGIRHLRGGGGGGRMSTGKYSLGSVLNHVLMHQTVIGRTLLQFGMADEYP